MVEEPCMKITIKQLKQLIKEQLDEADDNGQFRNKEEYDRYMADQAKRKIAYDEDRENDKMMDKHYEDEMARYLGDGKFAPGSHVREIEAMPKMSTKQRLVFLIDELEYAHEQGDTAEQHKLRLEIDHLIDFSL